MGARTGALLVAMVVLGVLAAPAQAGFLAAENYLVGADASALGYGDYTGDGIPDLVAARPSHNDIVISPGHADGTFGPALAPIAVGTDPVAVTNCIGADTLRDGDFPGPLTPVPDFGENAGSIGHRCDLAVSDAGSHDIAVLIGNGDGTFAPPVFIPVDGTPGAITVTGSGAISAGGPDGIVFTEPQQNRIGIIEYSTTQPLTFSPPTYVTVGTDPEAVTSFPRVMRLSGPWPEFPAPTGSGTYTLDWPVFVADAGSDDVRELSLGRDSSGQPYGYVGETWHVGSNPRALAVGSFGVAVADRDSGDVRLLGIKNQPVSSTGYYVVPVVSDPIPVPQPVALATVTQPGAIPYGDLAVVSQGSGTVTILHQQPWSGPPWPPFTSKTVSVPGNPAALVAWPFRPTMSPAIQWFAAQPATDLALLDPSGTFSVVLQDAARLTLAPGVLDFGHLAAGDSSVRQLSVTNIGRAPAKVDHISLPGTDSPLPFSSDAWPFSLVSDGCGGRTLAPGQRCTAAVRFAPRAPGEWSGNAITANTGADQSSAFAATLFDASASLQASVTSATDQLLPDVLTRGVRASARCSATCSITVCAFLAHSGALLGATRARLRHGRLIKLRIPIRASARRLARMRRAQIVIRSTASTTGYKNGNSRPVSLTLKQITVKLLVSAPRLRGRR